MIGVPINLKSIKEAGTMSAQTEKEEAVPLSGEQMTLLTGLTPTLYADLARARTVDDVMAGGACLVFFTTSRHGQDASGHWFTFFERPDGAIELFDSYGIRADQERSFLSKAARVALGEDKPLLLELFARSGRKVYVSHGRFQSSDPTVQTCGDWCATRLANRDKTIDEFWAMSHQKGQAQGDAWVVGQTWPHLLKRE